MRIRLAFTIDIDRAQKPEPEPESEQHEHRDGYSQAELADRHPIGFSPDFPEPDKDKR